MKGRTTVPVSCVFAPLGWWARICRLKNSTISSLRAGLGLMSAHTCSTEGMSSSPRWHSLIRQLVATDLRKMLRAETMCSRTVGCFSCLKGSQRNKRIQFDCVHLWYYTHLQQFKMIQDGHLALSSALEKKLNRVPWNPSVCTQQPCTSVWMTLHTKTRLMDLDEELNKR